MMNLEEIKAGSVVIIGGGLAGCEAAWQIASRGRRVYLYEMRPQTRTAAHQTQDLCELVCSNTFKSNNADSAPGQLKTELRALNSLIIACAERAKIPAGQALGVDRKIFAKEVTKALETLPHCTIVRQEVTHLPSQEDLQRRNICFIVATGPLTSPSMSSSLIELAGSNADLYFYDAIAPIIDADSIDFERCFFASRYRPEETDYLNIPLDKSAYEEFVADILAAEKMPLHEFEKTPYFESCLPIEVMAERGVDTLRFGPLKPVGLEDPKTGRRAWAVIQLRRENADGTMYSMVGFQTKMKWPEQSRVFKKIPALRNAEFLRFGSVHRNTYMESPKVLNANLSFRNNNHIFLAGQITGVEGYTESASMGLLAGIATVNHLDGTSFRCPPKESMIGALLHYVTNGSLGPFQPMNANFGLLQRIERRKGLKKTDVKKLQVKAAQEAFSNYLL